MEFYLFAPTSVEMRDGVDAFPCDGGHASRGFLGCFKEIYSTFLIA